MRIRSLEALQADQVDIMLCRLAPFFLCHAAQLERKLHVFHDRLERHQRQRLEDHAEILIRPILFLPIVEDGAAAARFDARDHVQEYCFSAASRPQKHQKLAIFEGKAHILNRRKITVGAIKRFRYVLHDQSLLYLFHGHTTFSSLFSTKASRAPIMPMQMMDTKTSAISPAFQPLVTSAPTP